MTDDKKVVSIRPDIAQNIQDYNKIADAPEYRGPSESIALVLKKGGFDEQAVNKGWIELRVWAAFTDEGCMVHGYSASTILNPPKVDLPAMPTPDPEVARTCNHHWGSHGDGSTFRCNKCGLAMGAKAWAEAYAPRPVKSIIMPGDDHDKA